MLYPLHNAIVVLHTFDRDALEIPTHELWKETLKNRLMLIMWVSHSLLE